MPRRKPVRAFYLLLTIITIALGGVGCSSSGTGLNLFSYEEEAKKGQEFADEINKQTKFVQDPMVQSYIQQLGTTLVKQGLADPHFKYQFQVINSKEVNAFAIPGGHVYVNSALLKIADDEAQVAGVVGHEIGHVVLRHGTKRMTDTMLLQVLAKGTEVAVGDKGGQYAGLGVALFGQAGLLHYGRNAELQADHEGIDILERTGYDVHAMPQFFKKLLAIERDQGVKHGGLSDLLATHPPTSDRIEKANAYIASLPAQQNPKENSTAFTAMKRHLGGS